MENITECPHCGLKLKEVGIKYTSEATLFDDVSYDTESEELSFNESPSDTLIGDKSDFVCGNCRTVLDMSNMDVVSILTN